MVARDDLGRCLRDRCPSLGVVVAIALEFAFRRGFTISIRDGSIVLWRHYTDAACGVAKDDEATLRMAGFNRVDGFGDAFGGYYLYERSMFPGSRLA